MTLAWKAYNVLGVIFWLSLILVWFFPEPNKSFIASPAVGALLVALVQFLRDIIDYDRNLGLQRKEHLYDLSVTSHMAKVAFDKHVEFSEEYISKLYDGLKRLAGTVPSREGTNDFFGIAGSSLKISSLDNLRDYAKNSSGTTLGRWA